MSEPVAIYDLEGEAAIQEEEFHAALEIYRERDAVRQGLWKEYTPRDQMVQVKFKVDRVMRCVSMDAAKSQEEAVQQFDEALKEIPDIMNYLAFTARLIRKRLDLGRTYV